MLPNEIKDLATVRLQHAQEDLESSILLLEKDQYKSAANRSYYAIFHAMRAVLALNNIDSKRHSGIISSFQRLYIKKGIFDKDYSKIITDSFKIRSDSDYDDFYIVSKDKVKEQILNAEKFIEVVKKYLKI